MLALAVALALAGGPATFPRQGMLLPGRSLAGVRLGESAADVVQRWGPRSSACGSCSERTWYYTYPPSAGDPVGAGVVFRRGRVAAIFTLGAPIGWRTSQGLRMGDDLDQVRAIYGGNLAWTACIGYAAMSMRRGGAVTSIYTSGEVVYGFALTLPSESVCR